MMKMKLMAIIMMGVMMEAFALLLNQSEKQVKWSVIYGGNHHNYEVGGDGDGHGEC